MEGFPEFTEFYDRYTLTVKLNRLSRHFGEVVNDTCYSE